MQIPVNHQTLLGDFTGDFQVRDPEDESELHHARMADSGSGEGSGDGGSPVSSRGNGGCIRDRPVKVIPCPRCQSMNTKFCYYNNYSVNQPRHFCRNCQRYWTVGGTLRNVPVGGGSRKKTRTRSRSDAHPYGASPDGASPTSSDVLLNASSCMQQLSMLPSTLGGFGANAFAPAGGQLPFLQFALEQGGMHPHKAPLAGLQEVPDLQSLYDAPQVPQLVNFSPMLNQSNGFFLPEFAGGSDALTSAMAKAGLWSSAPVPQLPPMSSTPVPSSWEPKANSSTTLLQQLNGSAGAFIDGRKMNATVLPQSWASKQAAAWDTSLLQPPSSRPMMHHDRLVPQHNTLWDQNVSPNGSNITTEEDRHLPSNCFGGYHDSDVVSQPWMGMQDSDILFQ